MRVRRLFSVFILCCQVVPCAIVRGAETSVPAAAAVADTLKVIAPRGERHLGGVTTVTVVDLDRDGAGLDLAELLEDSAGLQIRRYGGLGAPAIPSIRGSSATQVTVLIDGIPLSDALDGVLDLSTLPLDRFVRAEIYRGGLPAHLGGPGGVGAVNLITRDAGDSVSELRLSGGAFGEAGARLTLQGRSAGWEILAMLHGRRADNAYGYHDDNGTFANPDDDYDAHRRNAWFEEVGATLALHRGLAGGHLLRTTFGAYRRDAGVAGPAGAAPVLAADSRIERGDLDLDIAAADGAYGLRFTARPERDELHDPDREVGGDPSGSSRGDGVHTGLRAHGAWGFELPAGAGHVTAVPIVEQRREHYVFTRTDGVVEPRRERTATMAGTDVQVELPGLHLVLSPSLRWQRHEDDFPALPALPHLPPPTLAEPHVHEDWARSAAAIWEALPAQLFLEARAHRSARAPSWLELFGNQGFVNGNRELVPERITSRELAMRLRTEEGLAVRWTMFHSEIDRMILWVTNSQSTVKAENIGRTVTVGHEVELTVDLPGGASWWLSLTQQDARDRGDDPIYAGKTLPLQPSWSLALGAAVPLGPWTVRGRVVREASNWRFRYHGDEEAMPSRTVVGVAAAREWRVGSREWKLTVEGLNLTDDDVFDVVGYPLAGRSLRASVCIR